MSNYPQTLDRTAELYHWAPTTRRRSISRYGIRPGKPSVLMPEWRPPFVCFAPDPLSAWQQSAENHPQVPEWDLWTVTFEDLPDVFETFGRDDGTPKEIRHYGPVPGRFLFYAGTREQRLDYRAREPKPNDHSTKETR